MAPPPGRCAAAADLPTTGGLTKLKLLYLSYTQIADAGCAVLTAAFDSGALPALRLSRCTTSLPAPRGAGRRG